jgi:hypothetical protein
MVSWESALALSKGSSYPEFRKTDLTPEIPGTVLACPGAPDLSPGPRSEQKEVEWAASGAVSELRTPRSPGYSQKFVFQVSINVSCYSCTPCPQILLNIISIELGRLALLHSSFPGQKE